MYRGKVRPLQRQTALHDIRRDYFLTVSIIFEPIKITPAGKPILKTDVITAHVSGSDRSPTYEDIQFMIKHLVDQHPKKDKVLVTGVSLYEIPRGQVLEQSVIANQGNAVSMVLYEIPRATNVVRAGEQ